MKNPEKNPAPKAVALKYTPKMDPAPKVTAKGKGRIAEKIIELARKHKIPIREDPALVQILSQLDLNREIPPAVYGIVAEILAFIYSMNKKFGSARTRR